MDAKTKEALLRAAESGVFDSEEVSEEFLEEICKARELTDREIEALGKKIRELRGNPERLRTIWGLMGLR